MTLLCAPTILTNRNILLSVHSVSSRAGGLSSGTFKRIRSLQHSQVFNVTLITSSDYLDTDDYKRLKLEIPHTRIVYYSNLFWRFPSLTALSVFRREIANSSYVYLHSFYDPRTIILFLISLLYKRIILFRPHGTLMPAYTSQFSYLKRLYTLVELTLFSFSSAIVTSSSIESSSLISFSPTFLRKSLSSRTISVTEHYAVQTSSLYLSSEQSFRRNYHSCYVGRLTYVKGVDLILDAFLYIAKHDPSFSFNFFFAGACEKGLHKKLMYTLSALRGSTIQIHYYGHVPEPEKWRLLHDSYTFLFPTRSDSFGFSPLEAITAGCHLFSTPLLGCSPLLSKTSAYTEFNPTLQETIDSIYKTALVDQPLSTIEIESLFTSNFSIDQQSKLYQSLIHSLEAVK